MAIDALNRLVYPRLAVASMAGIHHAFRLTIRILGVALALGFIAAIVIYISASFMPLIFGPEYVSLPHFLRIMAWLIVFVAVWSIAVDLLGAAGQHSSRAWVLNLSNGIGAILIGVAAWIWPPYGIFIAGYMIEASIVLAAWLVVKVHVTRSLAKSREIEA
jgi:O-antigen/teichoic acid export membrane protein